MERRGAERFYVRTAAGLEVDFRVRYPEGSEELIQVCADLDAPATRERETRALFAAGAEYPGAVMRLISLTPDRPRDLQREIAWQLASEWLLGAQQHLHTPKPRSVPRKRARA